ncbi:MAG: BREX-1 system adenine-specific DNA-methyltransferase PglX [Desulfobacterales bacterium]|nr:BREX-1 system adenine-specific DNA-methyltransferase PglX [Desulfobacterales bacterium]
MPPLASALRNRLKDAVIAARDIAEVGSRAALEALAVHHHEPYGHMTVEERRLRNKLRAHARQLGDRRDPASGAQAIDRLVTECAYEHWHRMLFARYLAENHLLIEPETGVAISLEECEELAREEGLDPWTLAGRYAQAMLPQIFRPDDPLLQVKLARNHQLPLEDILKKLDSDIFTASDSLGWVYQFWQTRRKEEVNQAEVKIGADELSAVTQLFTEPYMVSFLIHNTLGAWWAAKRDAGKDETATEGRGDAARRIFERAETEEEVRRACAVPGVTWEYLRFVKTDSSRHPIPASPRQKVWTPAAGIFEKWPDKAAELKILDPCCGSGHFLVALFNHLAPLRMAEEGLSARTACDAVLVDNIHGLELDERCTQIAAFALALAAWQYPAAGGYRKLPQLPVACSGLSVGAAREEWKQLGLDKHNLRIALGWMHDFFSQAPTLGSLLDPTSSDGAKLIEWEELSKTLEEALVREQGEDAHEAGVAAQGLARAARILAGRYHWVITNVPYLTRGKQDDVLKNFCERNYKEAKNDIATVFLERCLGLCKDGGATGIVLPQNWLFLTTYKKFRKKLLRRHTWRMIARLGPGAFETISGEVVKAILLVMSRGRFGKNEFGRTKDEGGLIRGIDASEPRTAQEKTGLLLAGEIKEVEQDRQLENPDSRVALVDISLQKSLGDYCASIEGLTTGDLERFVGKFWEAGFGNGWEPYIQNVDTTIFYGGRSDRILWEGGIGLLSSFPTAHNFPSEVMNGKRILGKAGLRVTQMRHLPITIYSGEVFGKNGATVVPDDLTHLPVIWCFCSSPEYNEAVRRIDQSLKVTNATLVKVPFDLDHWTKIAKEKYPHGLPEPYSDDPTQWIFHGHPCGSVVWGEKTKRLEHGPLRTDASVLQIAVARLLGYRWPAELAPDMELADLQRQWVNKCDFLLALADEDGIVCIPSVRGEDAAPERLREMLAAAHGPDWSPAREQELLAATGNNAADLDDWLRNHFFEAHCKLFKHRPFIWHIWDGRKRDGFHALVNYHQLAKGSGKGRQLLEKLTYGYLGDWIIIQKDGVKQGTGGAEDRLAAALELEKRLKAILEGEPPFDIFVRWKPLAQQPIGWEPDINDGVRLNIRPFMADDLPGGKRGAGVLRWKPNIKWTKDRGKDVPSAPWYNLGPEYGGNKGDRINDHHLTIAEKRDARERMKKE